MADANGPNGDAAKEAYNAIAFDWGKREVYLANDEVVPMHTAEECNDRIHIVIIAGPTKDGQFIVYKINPEDYEEVDLTV